MHYAISATWGPTDPTRAMLPFIFAASALQAGDSVTLMLFHDAVLVAVEGAGRIRSTYTPASPPRMTRKPRRRMESWFMNTRAPRCRVFF